jgi:hypothetical protein
MEASMAACHLWISSTSPSASRAKFGIYGQDLSVSAVEHAIQSLPLRKSLLHLGVRRDHRWILPLLFFRSGANRTR